MSHEHDYEIPANPKWLVRREPSAPQDMYWVATWPTGIFLYARTWDRTMERIRDFCWARDGVKL